MGQKTRKNNQELTDTMLHIITCHMTSETPEKSYDVGGVILGASDSLPMELTCRYMQLSHRFSRCWNKCVAQQVGATSRSTPKNSAGIRQRGALAKNKNKNAPESKSNDYSKDIKALKKPPSTNYPRAPLPSDGTNRSVPKGMGNPNRPIPLQLLVSVTYVTLFSESSFASWLSKVCVLLHGERLAPLILHLIYSSKVNTAWLTRAIKADI